jgi:transcriptional regulator GlxA family with amidase domain
MDMLLAAPLSGSAKNVGLLLIDDFALLSYASVTEPLRVANLLSGEDLYRVRAIPASGAAAISSGGVVVPAAAQVGEQVDFDLVLIIAAGNPFAFSDTRVMQWIRHLARRGVALGGVSGGPVVLAASGLLANHRMTLHWEHAEGLASLYPELLIERSLYVFDRNRLTCAGGTAALDLMHAVITSDYGGSLAREVSDWLQHTDVRPGGGPQRAGVVERYSVYQPPLIEALAAMETHLADPLGLDDIAQVAGVGVRHLTRLFEQHLDTTPMRFYRSLRLEQAQRLLKQSGLPIGTVAQAVGFANSSHFSSAYRKHFTYSPGEERLI